MPRPTLERHPNVLTFFLPAAAGRPPEAERARYDRPAAVRALADRAAADRYAEAARALAQIRTWAGDDAIRELHALFRNAAPLRLAAARRALAAGRRAELARLLGLLKWNCVQLGAEDMQRLCEEGGRRLARRDPLDALVPVLDALDDELPAFEAWLDGASGRGVAR